MVIDIELVKPQQWPILVTVLDTIFLASLKIAHSLINAASNHVANNLVTSAAHGAQGFMGLVYIQSFHEEMVVYLNYSFKVIVGIPRYIYIYVYTLEVKPRFFWRSFPQPRFPKTCPQTTVSCKPRFLHIRWFKHLMISHAWLTLFACRVDHQRNSRLFSLRCAQSE